MKIGFCVWMAGRRVWVWTTHRANWVMFNHIYINIGYLSLFEVCNYTMWPSCPSSSQHDASPSLCWGQLGRVERGVIWRNRVYNEWWMDVFLLLAASPAPGMVSVCFGFRSLWFCSYQARAWFRRKGALQHFEFPNLSSGVKSQLQGQVASCDVIRPVVKSGQGEKHGGGEETAQQQTAHGCKAKFHSSYEL